MADAQLICPKRTEANGHQMEGRQRVRVSSNGLELICEVCGHRGRVAEFYVKSVSIDVPPASAVSGGKIPGAPG